jgi:DNA-binding LacI/PurR family transcriptional regulator/DNA-binding transcriptional regulator YhcF (GntR family)
MPKFELQQCDPSSSQTRYIQARNILADAIQRGSFPSSSKLPSTTKLAKQLNVSLITAHKAIQCLVDEGWLVRERGRGTFVRPDFESSVAAKPKFRAALIVDPENPMIDYYNGVLMTSIRRANQKSDIVGELIIQPRHKPEELSCLDVDGYIFCQPCQEYLAGLENIASKKAMVVLGSSANGSSFYCIDTDNFDGARQATQHLTELGHKRIAIINGPIEASNFAQRHEGYIAHMEANGLPVENEWVFNCRSSILSESELHSLAELLRSENKPTAIIAFNYYICLSVMALIRVVGLKIPEDISLVGFDDPKSAALLDPPLTTVKQPLEEMGMLAYQRMVQLINGQNSNPTTELLPTSLVIRQSTAPIT